MAYLWTIQPDGQQGTGVNPWGRDYPFVVPSDDLVGIFADASLTYAQEAVHPLRVAWLHGFDKPVNGTYSAIVPIFVLPGDPTPTHDADVVIKDATGRVVFDSTTATSYATTPFGNRLLIYEWRTDSAVCRLVQHTAVARDGDQFPLPVTYHPGDGRLDERVARRIPKRVRSIGIFSHYDTVDGQLVPVADPTSIAEDGSLWVSGGYNVNLSLTPKTTGLRQGARLVIDAAPGMGTGRSPGCTTDTAVIRTINGQPGNGATGNFTLNVDDCYWVRGMADSRITVGNDCKPCCDCADYSAVQAGILAVWDTYAAGVAAAQHTMTHFKAGMTRWHAQKILRESRNFHIDAVFHDTFIDFVASFANNTASCVDDVTLQLNYSIPSPVLLSPEFRSTFTKDGFGTKTWTPDAAVSGGMRSGQYQTAFVQVPPMTTVALQGQLVCGTSPGESAFATLAGTAVHGAIGAHPTMLGSDTTNVLVYYRS